MRKVVPFIRFIARVLTLAPAGLFAYAFVRGILASVALGASWYDWTWYIPFTLLICGVPIYLVLGLPRNRAAGFTLVLCLIWLVIGYNGFGAVERLDVGAQPPIAISFWTGLDFRDAPDQLLTDIHAAGGTIYMGRGDSTYLTTAHETLAADIRRLDAYHIPVVLVPALSQFLSAPVYREWDTNVHNAASFIAREHLTNVRGVIGDAEPPYGEPYDWAGVQRPQFEAAADGFGALIDAIHRDHPNLTVGVTANWPQYLDRLDGDADWSIVMRSPVDPPGNWDFLNVMTYSSYFPADARAWYVYAVEREMAQLYPRARVSHLLGLVGTAPAEPELRYDELVRDAHISRALSAREVVVFLLDPALREFGDDFIARLTADVNGSQASAIEVPFSRVASLYLYGVAAADALMDVRGAWGWVYVLCVVQFALMLLRSYSNSPYTQE